MGEANKICGMTGLSTPACAAVGLSVIHQGEQRAEVKLSVQSIESFCCSHSLCFSCCILSLIGFSPIPGRSTNVVEILEDCTGARLQWLKLPLSKPAQSLFRKLSKIYQLAGKKKVEPSGAWKLVESKVELKHEETFVSLSLQMHVS